MKRHITYTLIFFLLFLTTDLSSQVYTIDLAKDYYNQAKESIEDNTSRRELFKTAQSIIIEILQNEVNGNDEYDLLKMKVECQLFSGQRIMFSLLANDINRIIQLSPQKSAKLYETLLWCSDIATMVNDYKQARTLLEYSRTAFASCNVTSERERKKFKISYYTQLAKLERGQDRAPIAAKIQKWILGDIQNLYGASSDEYIKHLLELSETYSDYGKARKSNLYHGRAYDSYSRNIREKFGRMSETSRGRYWSSALPYFNKTYDVAYNLSKYDTHHNIDHITQDAFNSILLSKSILVTTSQEFDQFALETKDSIILERIALKQELIDNFSSSDIVDSIENSIIRRMEEIGVFFDSPHLKYGWKDVQHELGYDDLVIEFFQNSDGKYAALLLKKGWGSPLSVRIKDKDGLIEKMLPFSTAEETLNLMSEEAWALSNVIWPRSILKHFPTTESGKVYFSPTGVLSISAIEYMPFISPDRTKELSTIADNFNIYRITSSRELCTTDTESNENCAMLVGGPDYSLRRPLYKRMMRGLKEFHSPVRLIDEEYAEIISQERHHGKLPDNLKFSIDEVVRADSILAENNYSADIITGQYATEEVVKNLSGNKSIIHIATHGYHFSPYQALERRDLFRHDDIQDPMTRSGLYMTGVNTTLVNGQPSDEYDDGLLSSREISSLNLRGTDLVILSSCSSGYGELSEDGVFGLQRAFKKAGVNSMIMSLWKVHDKAAYEFMKNFYNYYIDGNEKKHTAFLLAQQKLRESTEYSDPFYWASFVMLDAEE